MGKNVTTGFTLIELSIVLVIIGLIVGGVLVGQDLIGAAEIRATIGQIEKFNTATNTFRNKYGYLPGDMPPTTASSFGFFTFTGANAGTPGYGDGDGIITGTCLQESLVYWRHLSDANLVNAAYGQTTGSNALDSTTGGVTNTVSGDISGFLPKAKITGTLYFVAQNYAVGLISPPGKNYFVLQSISSIGAGFMCGPMTWAAVTPITSNRMDAKIDDGLPLSGRVISNGLWGSSNASGECYAGGSNNVDVKATYNTDASAGGNKAACTMNFMFN